jgi:hypothetical protein
MSETGSLRGIFKQQCAKAALSKVLVSCHCFCAGGLKGDSPLSPAESLRLLLIRMDSSGKILISKP